MTQTETQAIVSISLMAAFVDGHKHDRERAEVKRIADALVQSDAVHLPTLVQDVLLKRVDLASTAAALRSADARHLAYEMAVCVCDADGVQSVPEQKFLAELRSSLGLDAGQVRQFTEDAEAVAAAPIDAPIPAVASGAAATPLPTPAIASGGAGSRVPKVSGPRRKLFGFREVIFFISDIRQAERCKSLVVQHGLFAHRLRGDLLVQM